MAPYGISITKSFTWRGQEEQFANVYHYDTSSPISTDSGWDALIDALVAIEKPLFDTSVAYKNARVWGPTNQGAFASVTQRIRDLTGTGSGTGGFIPPEFAVVCQFYIGRNPATQRKRFLRKYYHSRSLTGVATGDEVALGNSPLTTTHKSRYTTAMNSFKTVTVGGSANDLCTPSGDHLPLGSSPTVLNYLHVRQLKQ